MTFCVNCGRDIPDTYSFCPVCGAKRYQESAQPEAPKTSGRARGFGIASMAVGIEGMVVAIVFCIYALLGLLVAALANEVPVGAVFGGMAMIFSLISLASGIVGLILAGKSLAERPDFRFAVLGKGFSMAATIISGVNILASLLAILL